MAVSLPESALASIFVEGFLYGVFGVLFSASMFILLRRRNSRLQRNKPMICASVTMFVLATVHVAADIQRLLDAFITSTDADVYLGQVNTGLYTLKSAAYAIQTLVGDGFVVRINFPGRRSGLLISDVFKLYRLYLVWNGDKRVFFPILICFIASIGVAIGALQGFARTSPTEPIFITELQNWIVSFFSLTLFTNFSSLIAMRILWIHHRANTAISSRSVVSAAIVVIESGALYSGCLIILLSLYLSNSFVQYLMLDAVTQIIGIVFSLIIVRVGLGLSTEKTTHQRNTLTWTPRSGPQGNQYPMHPPVAVEITQDTHTEDTSTTGLESVKIAHW
ncbi:hypothetical protein J3R83DRAFT_2324 [Lanmaoa asiatica]|nr:hypothetical protein J3R83DRAFT_2324 [Lanmaoa asiatica]